MLCARGVRDSIISEQPGVVLAVHQNNFSRLTDIGYRLSLGCTPSRLAQSVVARSAKGKGRRERKGRGGALSSCDGLRGGSG